VKDFSFYNNGIFNYAFSIKINLIRTEKEFWKGKLVKANIIIICFYTCIRRHKYDGDWGGTMPPNVNSASWIYYRINIIFLLKKGYDVRST
jgi:hypothetical protein